MVSSTITESTLTKVALPSIHEMFPEYLLNCPPYMRLDREAVHQQFMQAPRPSTFPYPPSMSSIRRHTVPSNICSLRSRVPHTPQTRPSENMLLIKPSLPSAMGYPTHRRDSPAIYDHQNKIYKDSTSAFSVSHLVHSIFPEHLEGGSSTPYTHSYSERSSDQFTTAVRGQKTMKSDGISPSYIPHTHPHSIPGSSPKNPLPAGQCSSIDADDTSDGDYTPTPPGKKHICSICSKRFNRPSSLKIHINTHTGATPFRCPWPDCGRQFNVNSNMRRHYRNHIESESSESQSKARRRRRGGGPPYELVFIGIDPSLTQTTKPASPITPPISSLSIEEDSDTSRSDPEGISYQDEEEDELESPVNESWRSQPRTHSTRPPSPSPSGSASPYSSPAPSVGHSSPMLHVSSFMDTGISTVLRPAFHTMPTAPAAQTIKKESVSIFL